MWKVANTVVVNTMKKHQVVDRRKKDNAEEDTRCVRNTIKNGKGEEEKEKKRKKKKKKKARERSEIQERSRQENAQNPHKHLHTLKN